MADTRSGQASDFEDPYPERGRLKVGGRNVWVWRLEKDSDEPNPLYAQLKEAANQGLWVKVKGGEREVVGQRGKYTTFTAWDVEFLASDASPIKTNGSGSVSPSTPGKADQGITPDRPASTTDRVLWALDRAVDLSIAQGATGVPESFLSLPLEEKAKHLLSLSAQLIIENTFTEEKSKQVDDGRTLARTEEVSEEMKAGFA